MALRRILVPAIWFAGAAVLGAGLATQFQAARPARDIVTPHALGDTGPVAAPADVRWFDTEWGWIGVTRDDDAAVVAEDVRAAVAAFYRYFGRRPEPGAVLDLGFAGLAPELRAAGAAWLLPWPFRAGGAPGSDAHHGDVRSALRHEIGHALYLSLMLGNTRRNQYGGEAPDWLDEAAAMMGETPDATRLRRIQFAEAVSAGRVPSFSQLIAAEHPLFGDAYLRLAMANAQKAGEPTVLKINPAETRIDPVAIADFYASSRALADYLIERSGDDRILARISEELRIGGTSGDWLARLSADGLLPFRPDEADADFAIWAARRADD